MRTMIFFLQVNEMLKAVDENITIGLNSKVSFAQRNVGGLSDISFIFPHRIKLTASSFHIAVTGRFVSLCSIDNIRC